jgi:putative transposase
MSQSLAQIYVHIVFSTKDRRRFLTDQAIRDEMHRVLGGICNDLGSPVLTVGGVEDHVHILCRLGKICSPANFIKELKRQSSLWAKTNQDEFRRLLRKYGLEWDERYVWD